MSIDISQEQLQRAAERIREKSPGIFSSGRGTQNDSILKLIAYEEGPVRCVLSHSDGMLIFGRDGTARIYRRPDEEMFRTIPQPIADYTRQG